MRKIKIISILLILICVLTLCANNSILNIKTVALENNDITEIPELTPSFSNFNINDSLIINYEEINMSDYSCSIEAEGITATIVNNSDYLQCEVEAISNIEFGTLTICAISNDGIELVDTIYIYNNGEKLFYSEFSKDHALYESIKDWWDEANDYLTYKYWEEKYSNLMSGILSGYPFVVSKNNATTTIAGKIEWEVDRNHTTLPLKNAHIEILVKNDYQYTVLASTYTDKDGNYSLEVSNTNFPDNSDVYVRIYLEAHTFKVRSGFFVLPYYFDKKISHIVNTGNKAKFNATIGYDESISAYKATHVHQSMVIAERFSEEMGFESTTKIRVNYPAGLDFNNEDWALSNSAFCWGKNDEDKYCAIGWHKYNNVETVVHEYSHYIQCSMGNYGEPLLEILVESPIHDYKEDLYAKKKDKSFAMHLSWTEGWGYAFASMAMKYYESEYEPLWNNTYISDIDTTVLPGNNGGYIGEFQEKSVRAFLWSLVDTGLVNCLINNNEFSLDYKLPWTAQEWWNMTTVQGTYRLPDFINLIENESYSFTENIDYDANKEYIAAQLTKFSIAPRIINVSSISINGSPVIEWHPNGSNSSENGQYYSNNLFIVKLYNDSGNLIYTSDVINHNGANNSIVSYCIDQVIWNQIIANTECWEKIYVSIEGYRVDNVNDVYATSGPYCSEYYTYNLNENHSYLCNSLTGELHEYTCDTCNLNITFPHDRIVTESKEGGHDDICKYCKINFKGDHNYEELYKNDEYHIVKCTDCGHVNNQKHYYDSSCISVGTKEHKYICVLCNYIKRESHDKDGNGTGANSHTEYCTKCGYVSTNQPHSWEYSFVNNQFHKQYCTICGYNTGNQLHVLKDMAGERYKKCLACGFWVDTGGNDIFPIQSKPPKDPEEETE